MVSSQADDDLEYGTTHKQQQSFKSSALKEHKASDAKKRYAFLLGQTDIFKHFINVAKMKSGDKTVYKDFDEKKAGGRVRKTEKEEDEEMLADKEEEEVFAFSESPECKAKNRKSSKAWF